MTIDIQVEEELQKIYEENRRCENICLGTMEVIEKAVYDLFTSSFKDIENVYSDLVYNPKFQTDSFKPYGEVLMQLRVQAETYANENDTLPWKLKSYYLAKLLETDTTFESNVLRCNGEVVSIKWTEEMEKAVNDFRKGE